MRWSSPFAVLFAATTLACGALPAPVANPAPSPSLSTRTVLFDEEFVGAIAERSLVVTNPSDHELRIVSVGWRSRDPLVFTADTAPFVLAPAASAEVKVRFQPEREGEHRATLELIPAGGPAIEVDVLGAAVRGSCEIEEEVLDFGVIATGARAQAALRVENTGSRAWRAEVEVLQPQPAFAFADTRSGAPRQIEVSGRVELPVEFTPIEPGEFRAVVTVSSREACGLRAVVLEGVAVERLVVASTERLDFGHVEPGSTARARLRLSNAGAQEVPLQDLVFEGGDAGAFTLLSSPADRRIPAGGTVEVELAFSPLTLEAHEATLLIDTAEQGRAPLEVTLTGFGGGPKVSLPAAHIDFGVVALGTAQSRSIALRNAGTDVAGTELDNLRLESAGRARMPVITDGGAGEFSLELPVEGYTARGIAADQLAALTVRFAPRTAGRKSARVMIWTNDPERPVVAVTVDAFVRELPPCDLEVNPGAIDFGTLPAGSAQTVTVKIRNRASWATGTCSIFRVALGALGDAVFSLEGELGPFDLGPGESRTVTIRLSAPDAGTYEGRLELSTSGLTTSELRVPLIATVTSF